MIAGVPSRRYDSVQQDWRAFLPETKFSFYQAHSREIEHSYAMFSVSLNEAIDLRKHGLTLKAFQAAEVTPELCSLLVLRIDSILHAMHRQTRHFGVVPNMAPLEAENFRTEGAQRSARFSNILNHVLLSERSQFINKVSTLCEIAEQVGDCFVETVKQLEIGNQYSPVQFWRTLDRCHFDLNTCLREALVLLKSFLIVLPDSQVDSLDFTIRGLCRARPKKHFHASAIHARRIGAAAGK